MYIYPYHSASQSAKLLSEVGNYPRIKRERSRFNGSSRKTVLNWGCSSIDNTEVNKCRVLNNPRSVLLASDKSKFFKFCRDHDVSYVPQSTESRQVALQWVSEGSTVVCRTLTRASEGRGIVLASTPDELVGAPLYTKYQKKTHEFRIKVFQGRVIDVRQKVARRGVDIAEWRVRNTENGFTFQATHADERCPDLAKQLSIDIVSVLGLDFGGVDVIYHEPTNTVKIVEVNTAPGLDNLGAQRLVEAIESMEI